MEEDALDVMAEAAELFREYEAYHTAKLSEGQLREDRAARNRSMAERLEFIVGKYSTWPV